MNPHETRIVWKSSPRSPMTGLDGVGQASLAVLGLTVAVFRRSAESDSPACSECR